MSIRNTTTANDRGGLEHEESPTQQLDFETAMADFHTMFPDMELEVIEAVLRSNQGAVDTTIDQLLVMMVDNENEKSKWNSSSESPAGITERMTDASASSSLTGKSSTHKSCVNSLLTSKTESQEIGNKPLCIVRGWNTALVGALPPDFLRLGHYSHLLNHKDFVEKGFHVQGHQLFHQQMVDGDDMSHITMLLQSPEFVEVLRKDRDFMLSLDKEQDQEHSRFESMDAKSRTVDEDTIFKNRLSRMGRVSRRKLTQLARTFFRGTKFPLKNVTALRERPVPILCDEDEEWAAQNKSQNTSQKNK